MTPLAPGQISDRVFESWTMVRDHRRLSCTLLHRATGDYILRVDYDKCLTLDEPCDTVEQGMERSLEVFSRLAARGWMVEGSHN